MSHCYTGHVSHGPGIYFYVILGVIWPGHFCYTVYVSWPGHFYVLRECHMTSWYLSYWLYVTLPRYFYVVPDDPVVLVLYRSVATAEFSCLLG